MFLTPKTPRTPVGAFSPASSVKASPSPSPAPPLSTGTSGPFLHERLQWLKEDSLRLGGSTSLTAPGLPLSSCLRDKSGRGINDPDYNPRTVKVPADFLKKLTPATKQWWEIKTDNFDTVLMFKVSEG